MIMTAREVQDPLDELQRENDVLVSLLTRVLESAEILTSGKDVPPGEIAEELRLLDQYLGVHMLRLDQDLMPYARGVAMPVCFPHLDKILQDHEEVKERTRGVRPLLESYEQGSEGARARLALALEVLATKDHEGTVYEGDYPLSCLVTALPDDTAQRVAERFAGTQSEVADLDAHAERLLSSPPGDRGSDLWVRCAQEGCSATGTARIVPGHEGRLGLRVPSGGWTVVSGPTQPGGIGRARLRVDFFCASHASPPHNVRSEASRREGRIDEGGREAPSSPEQADRAGAGR
ncbi:MAG: hemerythrin domain-containing protein [Thermoplasmata archaeon]